MKNSIRNLMVLLTIAAPAASAQDWMATAIEHELVAPGIYMLVGAEGKMAGGNTGLLVGDEYVVLIDDGFEPLGPALLAEIEALAGRPADFVINTHLHGDHTGANKFFAEEGSVIVAHDNVRRRMAASEEQNTAPAALPTITFADELTFHVNDYEAFVFHLSAAHTDGDAAIFFRQANVIASGDVLFRGLFPFIDLDSGGSVGGYKIAMQALLDIADDETKIIPGHGPIASRADVEQDLAMLADAEKLVKALLAKGMDEDAIVAANPLAVNYDEYSWSFITTERMTRTLVRSLTNQPRRE